MTRRTARRRATRIRARLSISAACALLSSVRAPLVADSFLVTRFRPPCTKERHERLDKENFVNKSTVKTRGLAERGKGTREREEMRIAGGFRGGTVKARGERGRMKQRRERRKKKKKKEKARCRGLTTETEIIYNCEPRRGPRPRGRRGCACESGTRM